MRTMASVMLVLLLFYFAPAQGARELPTAKASIKIHLDILLKESPPTYSFYNSAYLYLTTRPQLSTLQRVVEVAGWREDWGDDQAPFTAFLPTNEAFEKWLSELRSTKSKLLSDHEALQTLLSYHVIPSAAIHSHNMAPGASLATGLPGRRLGVHWDEQDGLHLVDGLGRRASVVDADIRTGRAVVHIVDRVLLPLTPQEVEA